MSHAAHKHTTTLDHNTVTSTQTQHLTTYSWCSVPCDHLCATFIVPISLQSPVGLKLHSRPHCACEAKWLKTAQHKRTKTSAGRDAKQGCMEYTIELDSNLDKDNFDGYLT